MSEPISSSSGDPRPHGHDDVSHRPADAALPTDHLPTSADHPSELSAEELASLSRHASRVGTDGGEREEAGARIGSYRLLSVLGEGGFGTVWLAEQSEPVRRRVALKIIKPGMDSRDILARFEQERQALALMDHPSIAKVFDGGVTPAALGSRPYFVMELVQGDPITRFCDRERLDLRRRLDLFIKVCDAVQHAHHKGLVHRDIKPTNILVEFLDGQPTPKVIDFGVAKALHRPLTDKTLFTEHGRLIGTPEYMSPEQADLSAVDIDTRADIYSLGVLLYELLTGTLPFDPRTLRAAGLLEIQRIIRDVTPPRPSTRLSTIADAGQIDPAHKLTVPAYPPPLRASAASGVSVDAIAKARQTDPRTLARHLRRDLDWVVMKCLEKERNRRYSTASALGADLRAFLDDQPVSAGPPSVSYKAAKFARRHRTAVAVTLLVAVSLLAATIIAIRAAGQASAARDLAQQHARDAQDARALAEERERQADELSKYQGRMIQQIDAGEFGDAIIAAARTDLQIGAVARGVPQESVSNAQESLDSVIKLLSPADIATAALDQAFIAKGVTDARARFKDEPRLWARMAQTFATSYAQLGLYDKAHTLQSEALTIRRRVLGNHDYATLISIACLADLEQAVGHLDAAITLAREAADGRRALLGEDHGETQYSEGRVADMLLAAGKYSEAETIYAGMLDRAVKSGRETSPIAIESRANVGKCRMGAGNLSGAEEPISKAAALALANLPERDQTRIDIQCVHADWLSRSGRHSQARDVLADAYRASVTSIGESHPNTQCVKQALDAADKRAQADAR